MTVADCYVSSSLYEGMSTAILEAMAFGTPVVATDVYGSSEILKNKINGLLVPPGNTAALSQAICSVLKKGGRNSSMAFRAKDDVIENFSFRKMIDKVEIMLSECINIKN